MNANQATNTLDKVPALQRALDRAAKASAERRFHALQGTVAWYTAAPRAVR